jgi:oligosaccharyltransferase complex subunit gamma
MKIFNTLFNLIVLICLCLIPKGINAAISIDEFKKNTSIQKPIYNIPSGKLQDTITGLRDYNMIMLVTTSNPQYQCAMCEQFDPIYEKMVINIYKGLPKLKNQVIFTHVEAADHLQDLKSLGISSVPQIWGFPESQRVLGENYDKVVKLLKIKQDAISNDEIFENPDWYNLDQAGMEHYVFQFSQGDQWDDVIDKLTQFISTTINFDVKPGVRPEIQNNSSYWITGIKYVSIIIILYKIYERLKSKDEDNSEFFLTNKNLYAFLSIVLIFLSLSGFNFTTQRQSPFVSQNDGKILWIAPGNSTQFGSEVIISILLQIAFSLILILLINGVKLFNSPIKDLIVIISGLFLIGLLLLGADIYHLKSTAYPFNYVSIL